MSNATKSLEAINAFKAARREEVEKATAEERKAAAAAKKTFSDRLRKLVGDEVAALVKIEPADVAGEYTINVPDHLPILGKPTTDSLIFCVRRRGDDRQFNDFADALEFGQPYPLRPDQPADLPDGKLDTTKRDEHVNADA